MRSQTLVQDSKDRSPQQGMRISRSPKVVYIDHTEAREYLKSMLPEFLHFAKMCGLRQTQQSIETTLYILSNETAAAKSP